MSAPAITPPALSEVLAAKPQKGDGLIHVFCACAPDDSLCGRPARVGAQEVPWETPTTCMVCDDLEDGPCPRCGSYPEWVLASEFRS